MKPDAFSNGLRAHFNFEIADVSPIIFFSYKCGEEQIKNKQCKNATNITRNNTNNNNKPQW